MALRGWRLFGVAGTIFVYVTGILLLSLMSIQHPEQRRIRRVYQEVRDLMFLLVKCGNKLIF